MDAVGQRLENSREQLASYLEPSTSIRNTLIRDQGKLIALLYDEKTASDEMRRLKEEIEANRERLRRRPSWHGLEE